MVDNGSTVQLIFFSVRAGTGSFIYDQSEWNWHTKRPQRKWAESPLVVMWVFLMDINELLNSPQPLQIQHKIFQRYFIFFPLFNVTICVWLFFYQVKIKRKCNKQGLLFVFVYKKGGLYLLYQINLQLKTKLNFIVIFRHLPNTVRLRAIRG